MFRFVNSSSRTALILHSSINKNAISILIRTVSNQTKTVENKSSDSKNSARRIQGENIRQVNLRKLFSDEQTEEIPALANVRRTQGSNIPATSRIQRETSTKKEETTNFDGKINEGKGKYRKRSEQIKNSGSTTTEKTMTDKNDKAFDFDEMELVSKGLQEKFSEKQAKMKTKNELNLDKPNQPRKERSVTAENDELPNARENSSDRSKPNPKLMNEINETEKIEQLLSIFDQYVIPTEFAIGLQKLCRMASQENNDVIDAYQKSANLRERFESLLLGFSNKFSDNELVTSVSFVSKFYREDSEFTDKYSLAVNNRLRKINIHHLIRILEELKQSRFNAQWVQRTHNRLLSLAEGRYFEFDNIRDILTLTYKLPHNDRLISRLDERILEISDTLTFEDWFKVFINKSMLKRRDRTVIRAACYHLLKLSESSLFPLDKIKDSLLACAMLNVYDKAFLERLVRDAFEQVNNLKDPFMFQSIVTSMGALRLRHCEFLDALGQRLLDESDSFASSKTKCVHSFIRTCAAVNYSPLSLKNLISNNLSLTEQKPDDTNLLTELKNRIDLVWSLTILDEVNPEHLNVVLNQEVFQQIQNEVTNARIASALKLLSLYSYSNQKFSRKFLKPNFNIEQLAQQLTMKNPSIIEQIMKTINSFAAENKFSKFNVVTSNMIVIDCLLIVDKMGVPQDLSTILTNSENSTSKTNNQTTFNRVRLDENRFKIALKFIDYQDKTLISSSTAGSADLQIRLLNGLGYKCVPIHYDEFIKIQVPNDRVNFVQRKIKEKLGLIKTE